MITMSLSRSKMTLTLLALAAAFSVVDSYKILAIFPHTGKSHHIVFEPLLRALADKGHELTVISHYPLVDPPPTYKEISLAGTMHLNVHICDFEDFLFIDGIGSIIRHIAATYELFDLANLNCRAMTGHSGVKNLIKSNETFDLVLTEQFNSDCAFGIIKHVKAPVIGIASHVPMPWTLERFGMIENPNVIPSHFLKYGRVSSAMQAAEAFIVNAYYKFVYYIHTHYFEYRFLGGEYLDSRQELDEIANNLSMLFVTTYFPLHGSFPQPPNVIEIGGVHIPKKINALDNDIKKFLDDAKDGVIYFSMGSMIRGRSLPMDKLKSFQNAFSRLPYKVLWKWENETMPEISENIMIKPWMPQFEILSHENVKAFICHGGLLGMTEAVHLGVPVLVVPFFGDQFINGVAAEESGLGRLLNYDNISEESVYEAISDIMGQKIQESTERLSAIWKDRPQTPMEAAIFWIEHVAKFGGSHLRPASKNLPFYRHIQLDVLLIVSMIGIVFLFINFKILQFILRATIYRNKDKHKND